MSVEDRGEIVPYYQSSKHSMDSAKSFDFYIDQDFDKKADEKAHPFESVSKVSADLLTLKASKFHTLSLFFCIPVTMRIIITSPKSLLQAVFG
jgi:hypothetical protein